MPIIACINLKGGVAKTTNCVALAEACAAAGHRTLVIDADHQCMASECLMGEHALLDADTRNATLYDLIREGSDPQRKTLIFTDFTTRLRPATRACGSCPAAFGWMSCRPTSPKPGEAS